MTAWVTGSTGANRSRVSLAIEALFRSPQGHETVDDLLHDLDGHDRVQLAVRDPDEDSLARLLQLVVRGLAITV